LMGTYAPIARLLRIEPRDLRMAALQGPPCED
jgi:hypothetical protein